MRKRVLVTLMLIVSLAVVGLLAVGVSSDAEACATCVNGNCESGGSGLFCKEFHWANGSSVCEWQDGCLP